MTLLEKEISERRRGLRGYHEDFLGHLLEEDDKRSYDATKGSTLSDAEIQDNILTMIIAGWNKLREKSQPLESELNNTRVTLFFFFLFNINDSYNLPWRTYM